MNWLKKGLEKTRTQLAGGLKRLFGQDSQLKQENLDAIEELLLRADLGPAVVCPIMDHLHENGKGNLDYQAFLLLLEKELQSYFQKERVGLTQSSEGPTVVFVAGVNGTGKTTTIAKLAHFLKSQNKKVLFASCDTFRAAASDQLQIWADRLQIDMIQHTQGADAAAVVFDAVQASKARGIDYLLCDTAGRLHNNASLMEELKKMKRVAAKEIAGAPHETLLVLDATIGQNGFIQAKKFQEEMDVSGVVVTKLDGTAKAGVLVAIERDLKIPIKFVGVGEQLEDFGIFSPDEYVQDLFEN